MSLLQLLFFFCCLIKYAILHLLWIWLHNGIIQPVFTFVPQTPVKNTAVWKKSIYFQGSKNVFIHMGELTQANDKHISYTQSRYMGKWNLLCAWHVKYFWSPALFLIPQSIKAFLSKKKKSNLFFSINHKHD